MYEWRLATWELSYILLLDMNNGTFIDTFPEKDMF